MLKRTLFFGLALALVLLTGSAVAQTSGNIFSNVQSNGDAANRELYGVTTFETNDWFHPERENRLIGAMPSYLEGAEGIFTSHNDRSSTADPHLEFDLQVDAEVYVAWDDRCDEETWLADTGWELLSDVIDVIDDDSAPTRQLWKKTIAAGSVQLGAPNCSNRSNYFVFALPAGAEGEGEGEGEGELPGIIWTFDADTEN